MILKILLLNIFLHSLPKIIKKLIYFYLFNFKIKITSYIKNLYFSCYLYNIFDLNKENYLPQFLSQFIKQAIEKNLESIIQI